MTTLSAGRMGTSWETVHPAKLAVYDELGIDSGRVLFVKQKHTRHVERAEELRARGLSGLCEADGIISSNSEDILGLTVADCMPVFLHDERTGVRALLHSGWKGTGIALEAIEIMKNKYGCRAGDIRAVLGPAIGSCCYNVEAVRARQFEAEWGRGSVEKRGGNFFISMRTANRNMLEDVGITGIVDVDECTCCSGNLGSFRREGQEAFTLMMVLSIC